MLEVGLFISGTSRVVEVAEAEVAEATCTKSIYSRLEVQKFVVSPM